MQQAAEAAEPGGALVLGLVIAGPTGSGKTDLAAALARELGGEIVSADSRQVYRGLDAGTAKDRPEGVAMHLLDIATPSEPFDVGRFAAAATKSVSDIRARGARPIVVGGTGMYIKALLEGLSELPPRDEAVRARLEKLDEAALRLRLKESDPAAEAAIPKGNRQRLVRAVEVLELTGKPISAAWAERRGAVPGPFLAFRIDWPADEQRARLVARCRKIWPRLLAEVRALSAAYSGTEPGFESLGYREAFAALRGERREDEAYAAFEKATLAYAKRQRTWFRGQLKDARPIAGGPLESMKAQALRELARAEGRA